MSVRAGMFAALIFWPAAAGPALAGGADRSPIVVMGDKNLPPYEYLADGKPVGINVEVWQELAQILDRPLDFRLYQWAESQARVGRGEGKVLSLVGINDRRRKLYDFTRPTFSFRFPVFVLEHQAARFDIADLSGKRIAVKRGGFPRSIVENSHPGAHMVFVDSALEGFRKLLRGEVDGVAEGERVGYHLLRENDFEGIVATSEVLAVKTAHIAVVKGNPNLLRRIDDAVAAVKKSGEFDRIIDNWTGSGTIYLERKTVRLAAGLVLLSVVLILIVVGVLYVRRIREINMALTEEIGERKRIERALRMAKKEAENSDRFKSNFLTTMSHELRTPLNAILGFSELLEREMFGPLGDRRYKDYAGYIGTSGRHLLNLINDILDISRIESGNYDLSVREVDVGVLISQASHILAAQAVEKNIRISSSIDRASPLLRADERAVLQILLNLMSNSIKFTPEGGDIHVLSTPDSRGGLKIIVADTGVGIPGDKMDAVLVAYAQLGNVELTNESGSGLGLPIVKALIELHGGQLELESEVGRGTQVTVRFPKGRLVKRRQTKKRGRRPMAVARRTDTHK